MKEVELKYYVGNDDESRGVATAIYNLIGDCYSSIEKKQYTKEELYVDNKNKDVYNKGMIARVDSKSGKMTVKYGTNDNGVFVREETTYPCVTASGLMCVSECETQFIVTVNRKVNNILVGKRAVVSVCLDEFSYSIDNSKHYELEFEMLVGDPEALEFMRETVDNYAKYNLGDKIPLSTISKGERGYKLMGA